MWQTKYASAIPKNLGLGLIFGRAVRAISSLGVRSPCIVLFTRHHFSSRGPCLLQSYKNVV